MPTLRDFLSEPGLQQVENAFRRREIVALHWVDHSPWVTLPDATPPLRRAVPVGHARDWRRLEFLFHEAAEQHGLESPTPPSLQRQDP